MDEMTARVRLIQTVVWISAAIAKWVMALAFASLTLRCIFFGIVPASPCPLV